VQPSAPPPDVIPAESLRCSKAITKCSLPSTDERCGTRILALNVLDAMWVMGCRSQDSDLTRA